MISETTFAKKFTSFWNEILPNAKNYVRLVNNGRLEALYEPFEQAERKNNIALINVIYFNMFKHLSDKKKPYAYFDDNEFYKSDTFQEIIKESVNFLDRFSYGNKCKLPLLNSELFQIKQLFRLLYFHVQPQINHIKISPSFDGCGFLNKAEGDILSNNTLIEIKSGERAFSLVDFRQLVIYLALNHYSKKQHKIDTIELFNPRMGISYSEAVDGFCKNISSLDSRELFTEIQKFITDNNFTEEYGI